MKNRILCLDDHESTRVFVSEALRADHEVEVATSIESARDRLESNDYDLLLVDLSLPDRTGVVPFVQEVRSTEIGMKIIVLAPYSAPGSEMDPLRIGAFDYVTKPFTAERLRFVVTKALEHRELVSKVSKLSGLLKELDGSSRLVGTSPAMARMRERLARIAEGDAPVLIVGEAGTGKGLVAQTIHDESQRSGGPWVTINCTNARGAAIEEELFGKAEGNGVLSGDEGLLFRSEGGTLYLEEIADLTMEDQLKLVRFLATGIFVPVGGQNPRKANVRIVASSATDLEERVQSGTFDEVLYRRLGASTLRVPSLRERREDIPSLAAHFARLYASKHEKEVPALSEDALRFLEQQPWPGNVRELENAIEHGIIMGQSATLRAEDMSFHSGADSLGSELERVFREGTIRQIERLMIEDRLRRLPTRNKVAETLGISVRTLRNKLHLYKRQEAVAATGNQ